MRYLIGICAALSIFIVLEHLDNRSMKEELTSSLLTLKRMEEDHSFTLPPEIEFIER